MWPTRMQNGGMIARGLGIALAIGFVLQNWPCNAQSRKVEDLAQGKILIAPRDAPDPHFARSVIVLAQYSPAGALGLMLQYRSDISVQKALPGIKAGNYTEPVFVGGPVELSVVLALRKTKATPDGAKQVLGDLYLLTSHSSIGAALAGGSTASDLRVFFGYSGWAAGQLDREVRRLGWYIFDFDEGLVFDDHPETLWDRLIARTERRLASARRYTSFH